MDLVVSHDSGGAELISSWIKFNKNKKKFFFCVQGPAKKIFKKNIGIFKNLSFEKIKKIKINKIITGTSWESDLENRAIIFGKNRDIHTISCLDHWNNYKERFYYKKKMILPREIHVVDEYAYKLARKKFKDTKIIKKKNYYEINLLKKLKKKITKKESITTILYLTEPIFEHAKKQFNNGMHYGYEEFFLLERFFKNLKKFTKKKSVIFLRNHPSEKKNKYLNFIKKYTKFFNIKISNKVNLFEDINRSDVVVGNQSMAMVMALYAKKKTFSILPNLKHKVLPHKNIKYI